MKNLIPTLLFAIVCLNVNAQRVIEKNIDYKDQMINIEVPFASEIELKTWNKPTIYVKANLITEEGKYLDLYEIDIDKSSNNINIVSKAEEVFKKFQEEDKMNNSKNVIEDSDGTVITYNNVIINEGTEYDFDYVIYIPEGARFQLSSINGNLEAEVIRGDFTADLINGKINIKEYSGDMQLNTINGEIEIELGESTWMAETIHGNIYADEDISFTSEERFVGQQLHSEKKNGGSKLHLSTINGNMYLR